MKLKFVDRSLFFKTFATLGDEEVECAREYIDADYDFGGFEVLCSYFAGCIVFRYYSEDVGYHFDAPIPLSERADEPAALRAISDYCLCEAIPEIVVGLIPELLNDMLRGAEHYSIGEDDDGTLAVKIITECMECEFLPEVIVDDVCLGEFADKYAPSYEKLLKDANLNCHFGYNILDDIPNGSGKDFIKNAREEFERSESMTFAATVFENGENVFVGEGVLYAFDGRGRASVSFRVLPEYHGRGIGRKIFRALMKIAAEIGLRRVIAEVKNENTPSLSLLSRFADGTRLEKKTVFEFFTADFG